jgi:DNA-binding NarL/FixJ family response regulator
VLDHWPLVGRGQELDEVSGWIADDAVRGVALAGRPGVGKSRLAREAMLIAAQAGWTVRSVAATATSSSIALGAFARWTDDVERESFALVRSVIGALTDGTEPHRLVVLVDDAHLLDDLSAVVVHQLIQSQAATVVLTIRTGESAPAAVTALWKDGLVRRRELGTLSRGDVTALLSTVFEASVDPHCEAELWRLTGGNALFVRQLVEQEFRADRMATDQGVLRWTRSPDLPASLVELMDAQFGTITATVCDVVDLVALAEPLDRHILSGLADQDAIEEAEQRELIRVSGEVVYVGHPMYAEVRLARCGTSRRRRLRGVVAQAMKGAGLPADIVKRGLLWVDSDLPPEPGVLLAAATAASSLLDFETAERLFTVAANIGVGAKARIPLAYSLFNMDKGELALEVLAGVEPDDATESAFINDVILRASNVLWAMRSPERSWRVIDDALETSDGARRQQLLVFRANQLALAARPVEVLSTMAEIDYGAIDDYGSVMGYSVEAMAYGELGQADRAVAMAGEADRSLTLSEQGKMLRQPLTEFHTFALAAAGRLAEAVEVAERHYDSQSQEPKPARVMAAEILGMVLYAAGDLNGALRYLPEDDDPELANNFHVVNSFHRFQLLRAQALARLGDTEGAERALDTARVHRHPAYVFVTPTELLTEAWLAAARQRPTEARLLARRAAEFARQHDQLAREVWCLQTAAQFDDTEAAERLAELASRVEGPRVEVAVRYAVAVSTDAADELDAVSADFEAMRDLLTAADAAGQAATAYRRAGRPGRAMTAAARAQRLAGECGGATSPAIAAASFAPPFTNREREIAVLVARGLSNREIAETVSLSVRTVESHIYRASTKAGVNGRTELAAMMRLAAR